MDFSINEETQMLVDTVKKFVDRKVDPLAQRIEEEDRVPDEILDQCKALGLFGLSIPSEYGGVGIDMVGKCLVFEQLGRTCNGFTTLIGAHNGIGSVGIVEMGTEEQKKKYLPRIASGETIGAFALTEPNAGSDAAAIRTRAERKGDHYVLNGTKHFITNGPIAGVYTVMAVTDKSRGAKGITSFIVDREAPGLSVGKIEKKMGLHGSSTSEIIFEDCVVPVENVLGEEGQGYVNALKILANGRAGLAARNLGSMQKLLELSVRYSQERIQFDQPIANFQAVGHLLADMAVDVESTRSFTYRVAWMVDQGMKVIKEAAMVKYFASEAYCRVADKAVQVFGGMGYMAELPIERYYRDARITRIYEGTSEIQKNIIAAQLLRDYPL
ncbi:MAG: acyl-CoA dehydrogenase family protein [Desulfomonile tiedjei]|nr:acyl-CoA dehydrogenase family protein [Desulfomonile tiedjei]